MPTRDSGLGFHAATLDVARRAPGERVEFTWQWQESSTWHGRNYEVAVSPCDEAERSADDPIDVPNFTKAAKNPKAGSG
jgi:hypothetical protein